MPSFLSLEMHPKLPNRLSILLMTLTLTHRRPCPRFARSPLLAYVKSITKDLTQVSAKDLAQVAWNFINDSLRTTIALHVHTPAPRRPGAPRLALLHVACGLSRCRSPRAACHRPLTARTARLRGTVYAAMCGGVSSLLGVSIPGRHGSYQVRGYRRAAGRGGGRRRADSSLLPRR